MLLFLPGKKTLLEAIRYVDLVIPEELGTINDIKEYKVDILLWEMIGKASLTI